LNQIVNKEDRAVAPVPSTEVTPMSMLQMARDQNADIEQMRELMAMQFKWEENEARKAYMRAVAAFKSEPIKITKDKDNNQYKSRYTSIGNLVNTANAELSKFDLNAHWEIDQSNGISVTCILAHAMGHSEKTSMTAPPDKSGSKNPIQEIKSTITYLKVATYEAILGVASTDDPGDTDGNMLVYVSEENIASINALIEEVKADKKNFLRYLKVKSLDELLLKDYRKAIHALESKRK